MNEAQKNKRNFRQSKEWKNFRLKMKKAADNKDLITNKPLRKGYQTHHRNLDETQYEVLIPEWFLSCNNMTHKFIHWLYVYYQKDPEIIDRLKKRNGNYERNKRSGKMKYLFKCKGCGLEEEKEIPINEYSEQKEKQICKCGEKMDRVIQWTGIAEGSGQGWHGKNGSNCI